MPWSPGRNLGADVRAGKLRPVLLTIPRDLKALEFEGSWFGDLGATI